MQHNSRWHTLEMADQVALAACQQILASAEYAIAEHGRFKLVLAGGSTPEKVYRLLAQADADWAHWFIYYGDERCLPADHADRNSLMATQAFLEKVSIPDAQIFTIPAELGPEPAAKKYQQIVASALPFDMVLLGMGEDGHTASLFPGHQHREDELAHAVYNSPKPPPERVSISARALSNTRHLIFLITGANKQEAVRNWRSGQDLPVATITPENPVDIYIDRDAYNA
ncbi:MAG: 6-phosphogluconolactonase [Methylococcaceae bacterium]|jgi:6-phosphogluconolactonase|nr:6-phosphogluconolactonase [Methylococcaceae bacterium]MDD1642314.1 6-phosphogluconolactonase [Methylococcaceae bacterium]OYV18330.1 MAG: 6-phosphogluconolactonase [Methylococcaceae bacterium NSM2-1]